jgi:hypothetical protein
MPIWLQCLLPALAVLFTLMWFRLGTTPLASKPSNNPDAPPHTPGNGPTIYYRTKDGRADYGFTFTRLSNGSYRIYIDSHPPYGLRPAGIHATHRLSDGNRQYVCWSGLLRSEEEARKVAALWAEKTQTYIRYGVPF